MQLKDKVVAVTGGASGIGRALCARFVREGARAVVVADRDEPGARAVAGEIGATAVRADVARESDIVALVDRVEKEHGRVDLFCSNAGIVVEGGPEASDDEWERIWRINVLSHVYAARALVPRMLKWGGGYFLNTASAAGLLSQIGSAPYSVTKHGAVAFAEWLSITYGSRGIGVSCLCPQGVRTNMLNEDKGPQFLLQGAIEPEVVADAVVEGLKDERFLILPHPEVLTFFQRKASDYDRWIHGMRRLQAKIEGAD